jgi:hypothetical protein
MKFFQAFDVLKANGGFMACTSECVFCRWPMIAKNGFNVFILQKNTALSNENKERQ